MRRTVIGLLLVAALISLPFAALATQDVPEDAPEGAIRPSNGNCPNGYSQISYNMGIFSIKLCVPMGNTPPSPPDPQPGPGPTPPPQPEPTPPQPDPDPGPGPGDQNNPPDLGSPPSTQKDPDGYKSPPSDEKGRALQEKPDDKGMLYAVRKDNLYFYYRGRFTRNAATYLGQWIPVYVNLPRGGNLQVYENYYRSGRNRTYNWGYRPAGWTKFWFYADTRGWHALISNTNGSWGNWIWVYVY